MIQYSADGGVVFSPLWSPSPIGATCRPRLWHGERCGDATGSQRAARRNLHYHSVSGIKW